MPLFWAEAEAILKKYDLLCHPFYQAWSAGQLTSEDLSDYASDYYHHVAAFPTYLSAFHARLEPGPLRQAVLQNLCGEELVGVPHSDLWLDFAAGMGADRDVVRSGRPSAAIRELVAAFREAATTDAASAVLATFYAYESQVPAIAQEKARGLVAYYGADADTCRYFLVHVTADVAHSTVWRTQLDAALEEDPGAGPKALFAMERAASALWAALDGIEERRQRRMAQAAN